MNQVICILYSFFMIISVALYIQYFYVGVFHLKVIIPTITIIVLLAVAYVMASYAKAQGKADYLQTTCGMTLTPFTIMFYPGVVEVELDYCLDIGKQKSSKP